MSTPIDRPADKAARPSARSYVTRALHLALLLAVAHQLIGSNFAERPLPDEAPEWQFRLHEVVGFAAVGFVGLYWIWTLIRDRRETPAVELAPWFSSNHRGVVFTQAREAISALSTFRLPGRLDALAHALQGLGLIAATGMAATGAIWALTPDGSVVGSAAMIAHELIGKAMWAFIVGHAAMALAHQLLGEPIFAGMFGRLAIGSPRRGSAP